MAACPVATPTQCTLPPPPPPPRPPHAGVRLIIALSSALTVLYTPLFKRQTLVKNVVVAATIAAAPLAGALAAGAAGPGLRAVLPPCLFLFLGILHREIIMDIQVGGGWQIKVGRAGA